MGMQTRCSQYLILRGWAYKSRSRASVPQLQHSYKSPNCTLLDHEERTCSVSPAVCLGGYCLPQASSGPDESTDGSFWGWARCSWTWMDDRPADKWTKLLSDIIVSPPRVPSSLLLVCKLNREECMQWVSSTDVSWWITSFWSAGNLQAYFTTRRLSFN